MDKKRIRQLAGLTEQQRYPAALDKLIVVHDPMSEDAGVMDILYEAPAANIVFWAKGLQEDPREIHVTFYAPQDMAQASQDAAQRIQERRKGQ